MSASAEKISVTEKIGYSLGDCAANFVFQMQIFFLASFYTDVVGIAASTVGWIFLFSRLWDAVNDPLMGALSDRTKTRWGRFRPWVLITALPFAVAFVLTYTSPDLTPQGKVVWAFVTYNALMMIYTANNIPYSALTGVITSDPAERTSLTSWRFLLAMTAAFLISAVSPILVKQLGEGDLAQGYQYTVALWAVLAMIFFIITFSTTKERVQPDPQQKTSVKQDLADLIANPNWIALSILTVFVFIYLAMRGGMTVYFFDYFVDQKEAFAWDPFEIPPMSWFNGLGTLASIVGIFFSKPLAIRFGKRDVFRASLFACAILTTLFYFVPSDSTLMLFGLHVVLQFIYGFTIPLLWAMMADVADFGEWANSRRATGMTFAATVFALKLGLSLGGALVGWLLSAHGYVANETQTESSLNGIRLLMSVYPAIAFFIGVAALFFYKINLNMEHRIHVDLVERRKTYQTT